MTEAITTVPALLRGREPYRRPMVSRFTPSELDKKAVNMPWIDPDIIARCEIESGNWITSFTRSYRDRHGYPTA